VFDGEIAGKTVTIFGMGPIGVCAVGLCKLAGAEKVIALDHHESRLKFAKDFGADVLINSGENGTDVKKEIMDATDGKGADVFLEMAGSAQAMRDGLATIRPGGRASILGVFSKPVELDVTTDIVFKGIRMSGINGRRMFDTWYKTKALLPKIKLERLVTHRLKLSEIEKGFQTLMKREGMKVVLEP
jgi:threonine 3-dehydrogenase